MKNVQMRNTINLGLLRFANNAKEMEARMVKFSENPLSNLLDLQLFQIGIGQDAAKGVLVMNNKLTDISEDAMKILNSVAELSFGEKETCIIILETVLRGLEDGEPDIEALYKFYEVCKLFEIAFEISYSLTGDGNGAPFMEACYLANPEKFEQMFTGPNWEGEFENYIQEHVINIFSENADGRIIHKKLNELYTSELPESVEDMVMAKN